MEDSKELWLKVDSEIDERQILLGKYTSDAYRSDPKTISFIAARYKFCAKIMEGFETVLEVGCGDGFGSMFVADAVSRLICTDVNERQLSDNRVRNSFACNTVYEYFDFRAEPYSESVDGMIMVDVIEHIYPEEEQRLLKNLCKSLRSNGVMLIGTPNERAERYASKFSRKGHVNLKDHNSLKALGKKYFHNVFMFGMNDEVVHTGFPQMAHYLWALCVGVKP